VQNATKQGIRKLLRDIRAEAAAQDPDAGEKLADVFPMKLYERYGPVVAGYCAVNDEICPLELMQRLALSGAALCLPRVGDEKRLSFHFWEPGEPLVEGRFGLKEPLADAPLAEPTLVLVPLLGFDGSGTRIGYGHGHYDRALSALRQKGRTFACGVAYQAQMMEDLPFESHDEPLDWAITERGSVPLFMMRAMAS